MSVSFPDEFTRPSRNYLHITLLYPPFQFALYLAMPLRLTSPLTLPPPPFPNVFRDTETP